MIYSFEIRSLCELHGVTDKEGEAWRPVLRLQMQQFREDQDPLTHFRDAPEPALLFQEHDFPDFLKGPQRDTCQHIRMEHRKHGPRDSREETSDR
jgi:hypothetical protein